MRRKLKSNLFFNQESAATGSSPLYVGGILGMLEIAALAHDKGVAISPHCWNSMTVAATMLHVFAVIPNAKKAEIYPEYISNCERFVFSGFILEKGQAILSDQPGLGVEVNVTALAIVATDFRTSNLALS